MVQRAKLIVLALAAFTLSCSDGVVTAPRQDDAGIAGSDAAAARTATSIDGAYSAEAGRSNANPNANANANGNDGRNARSKADGPVTVDLTDPDADSQDIVLDSVARYRSAPGVNGVERAVATIGPAGGSVRLRDFEVIVPAGAVDRDMKFEIRILPEPARDSHAWATFSPHNHQFAVPVILRVPLESTESAGSGDAHVLWWSRGNWVELPTTVTPDGRLETQTDHFSVYATQRRRGITMVGG